jgi:hypothetical protein
MPIPALLKLQELPRYTRNARITPPNQKEKFLGEVFTRQI